MTLLRLIALPVIYSLLVLRFFWRITGFKSIKAMLEYKHEIPKQPFVAAGIISAAGALAAGALKLDRYFGSRGIAEEQSEPEFLIDLKPDADKTLILLGGLCMNTENVAKRYRSELADDTNLVAPLFPEKSFDPESLFEKTYQHVEATAPQEIKIVGLSMGGLLGWDWLDYGLKTGRRELVEKVTDIGLWGTPVGKDAIRFAPRMLLNTVSRLGYSYTLDHGRSLLKGWNCKSLMEAHPAKVVPQCRYLASNHAGPLSITPARIVFVMGAIPDPIVNEEVAARAQEQKTGRSIERAIYTDMERAEHAPTSKKAAWFMLNQLAVAKPLPQAQAHTQFLPQAA
jgi:hypothetical protein